MEIASLFATNAALDVSDGVDARVGTLTAGRIIREPAMENPIPGGRYEKVKRLT